MGGAPDLDDWDTAVVELWSGHPIYRIRISYFLTPLLVPIRDRIPDTARRVARTTEWTPILDGR